MVSLTSDDFSVGSLDGIWSLLGPAGSYQLTAAGSEGYLELVVPQGSYDPWNQNNAVRMMQAATNTDFGIEVKFLSSPTQQYQMQGILIEQDASNWIRFDTYSDGAQQHVFAAVTLNGSSSPRFDLVVPAGAASYLRADRVGDTWTFEYSADGLTWATAGSFTQALTVSSAGVFAGSTGSALGYTAQVDYFFNSAAPILNEDASIGLGPVAQDDTVAANLNTALVLNVATDLLANDTDPNGDPLSLTGFTQPAHGTLVDNTDGTLTYTPIAGYIGADSFIYTITDGTYTDTATVNLTVNDSVPVAQNDTLSAFLNTALVLSVATDLLANDSDPNGDPLSLTGFTQPANGNLVDNGDGTLTYTPNAGYAGADSFAYSITDGTSTANATVDLTVIDPFAPPAGIASDDFSAGALDASWSLLGPAASGQVISSALGEGFLELSVLQGDFQPWHSNTATRAMQTAVNSDFGIEAKFLSTPTQKLQMQGILIEQNASNWIRFDTYSDGTQHHVFAAVTLDGVSTARFNLNVAVGAASHLRVDRVGDTWSFQYSADGVTWTTAGGATQVLDVTAVGVFAGATGGAPGYTAQVDYFFNTAAPILAEDATVQSPPVAQDDVLAADLDTPLVLSVANDLLANDSDFDGDPLSLTGFTQPAHGTLVDNGDGTLTYSPNTGYTGVDSFTYTIGDGTGGSASASVSLTVSDPLAPPVAQNDAAETNLDTPLVLNVATDLLANDSDPNGDPLSLTGFTQPANGTLVDNGDGTLTYSPNTGYAGVDSFTYSITDGNSTTSATVNLTVIDPALPGNISSDDFRHAVLDGAWSLQGPAGSLSLGAAAGQAYLEIVVPQGDFQPWNNNTATRAMQAALNQDFGVEAKFLSNPTQRYQMQGILIEQDANNWIRLDTHHDGKQQHVFAALTLGGSSSALFNLNVAAGAASHLRVERVSDTWSFQYSADGVIWTTAGGLTHALTVTAVGPFAGATANAPGYTAQVDYFFNTAAPIANEDATIERLPIAQDDSAVANLDTPLVINVANDLLANDSDPNGDPLSLTGFAQPLNGTLIDNGDGTLTYIPNAGYAGADSFAYTITDGTSNASATVNLTVIDPSVPPAGIISDDFWGAVLDGAWSLQGPAGSVNLGAAAGEAYLEIVVPQGDFDPWQSNRAVRMMQTASNQDFGVEAKFLSNPTQRYQMQGILIEQDANNWIRFDTRSDGAQLYVFAAVTVDGLTTARFNLSVAVGSADYMRVDRVGDTWSFQYSADGVTWTTAGGFTHALTVTAVGPFAGATASAPGYTAQVDYFFNTAVPILAEDNAQVPPSARNDTATTTLDTPLVLSVAGNLLANDSDVNGDPLSMVGFTQPAHGLLVDNADGTLTYTPSSAFTGVDSFTYTISDGAAVASAIVTLEVDNVAPVALNDTATTNEDTAAVIAVLANDSDSNGDPLQLRDVSKPANGTVTANVDGTLTYFPNANFYGQDTFFYTISDGAALSPAIVQVTVNPVPDTPIARNDFFSTRVDTSLTISVVTDLLANDSDGDGDPLSFTGFSQPANGTLTDNGNGTLTYVPNVGFNSVDAFTYTISDGTTSASASAQITVSDLVDVWYGDVQTFGGNGEAQRWINILGNVDSSQILSLSYSLNGGADRVLTIGADTRRNQNAGDFNIDIDYAELNGTTTDDIVSIKGTLSNGAIVTKNVTVVYEAGNQWASNYHIDWATVTDIQDVVQVADGQWIYDANGIRPAVQGYDRLLTLGDDSWDNYEVNLKITMNDLTTVDPLGRDGGGFAFGMLWNGHTDNPVPGLQPKAGWVPGAAFFFDEDHTLGLHSYSNFSNKLAVQPYSLLEGSTYDFTIRVEQTNVFDRTYSIKYWEDGTVEPTAWNIQGTEQFSAPANGSLFLNAHYFDVTFGNITVTEIVGSDIVQGRDTNDTLMAVNTSQANPGLGEIDVFTGGAGADTFVFGDASGAFYDDGNAATDGLGDYGLIWDFATGVDQIQLAGTVGDYVLGPAPVGLPSGTAITHVNPSGPDELIGIVDGVSDLSLNSSDFILIGIDPGPPLV